LESQESQEKCQESHEKYQERQSKMEQLYVLSQRVELKLRHWPNTAHSFIGRLTNQRPVFFHS
jgi:hypothetical protein